MEKRIRKWWQLPLIEKLTPEEAKNLRSKLDRRYLYIDADCRYDSRRGEYLRRRDEKGAARLRRLKKIADLLDKRCLTAEDVRFLNVVLGIQMVAKIEATSRVHPSESAVRLAEQVAAK